MNFFTLASALLLFQLNISWATNYGVKLIGFLLFAVGCGELISLMKIQQSSRGTELLSPSQHYEKDGMKFIKRRENLLVGIKKQALLMSAMCGVALIAQLLLKLLKPSDFALNVISIILGAAVTAMSLQLFRIVYTFITDNEKFCSAEGCFVNNEANVTRLGGSFSKLAIVTLVNFGCDVLNRLVPITVISNIAGIVVALSKVIMYIMLIVMVYQFNKVRVDCNKKTDSHNDI